MRCQPKAVCTGPTTAPISFASSKHASSNGGTILPRPERVECRGSARVLPLGHVDALAREVGEGLEARALRLDLVELVLAASWDEDVRRGDLARVLHDLEAALHPAHRVD